MDTTNTGENFRRNGRKGLVFTILCSLFFIAATPGFSAEHLLARGHVPPEIARLKLQSLGRYAPTNHLDLAIGLPLRHPEILKQLLRDIYDPASPHYHHYLTPGQFAASFGPTPEQYETIKAFARTNGLTVTGTHANRLLLDVGGSVASVEKAFHVRMRVFHHPQEGRLFYAPDTEPTVGTNFPVLDISGLDNYRVIHPTMLKMESSALNSTLTPDGYDGTGPNGDYQGYDFRTAYAPGVSLTGAGQSVALVEFDGYYAQDITAYASQTGLPTVPIRNVLVDGFNGNPGEDNLEVALDIDMVTAMAPGLSGVIVYECPNHHKNYNDVINRIATDDLAAQISSSWESPSGPDATTDQIFQQFAAQGQTFFQAAGDDGAFVGASDAPCDNPLATVVGGTYLSTGGYYGGGTWADESVWNTGYTNGISGGGISTVYSLPDWQQGIDMSANQGSTTLRNAPDVAMAAAHIFVLFDNGSSGPVGGTSASAPLWAGFMALVNEQAAANSQPNLGFLNPALYAVAKGPNYAADFHDIVNGDNTSVASPNRYYATGGYDLCTGWGSPAGQHLIDDLTIGRFGLNILPSTGFGATGITGGAFDVTNQDYVLSNSGWLPLNWSLINTSSWLNASVSQGILAAYAATNFSVTMTAAAYSLAPGNYDTTLLFSNWNDGSLQACLFTIEVLSTGSVQVAISPVEAVNAGARWQVDGGDWQDNGGIVSGLSAGGHTLSFSSVANWATPADETFDVASNQTTMVSANYLPLGSLQVTINPPDAGLAGAEWQVDGSDWQTNGATIAGLADGDHTLVFSPINNWEAPSSQVVTITNQLTTIAGGSYIPLTGLLQVTIQGLPPGLVEWSVDGVNYQPSGAIISLSVGGHTVSFPPYPSSCTLENPSPQSVYINGDQLTQTTGTYAVRGGALQVGIFPQSAVADGARWQVDGGPWQTNGAIVYGLMECGYHTLTFLDVNGWATPISQNISISTTSRTTIATGTYQANPSLRVLITPAVVTTAGAQWQVDGGAWQNSGNTILGLIPGNHTVTFSDLGGWTTPAPQTLLINSNQAAMVTGNYIQQYGSLQVLLDPTNVASAGAEWQVDGGPWQTNGTTISGVALGDHDLSFLAISNWITPADQTVTINANQTNLTSVTYVPVGSVSVTLTPAAVIAAGALWQLDDGPWETNGAIVFDVSYGSHVIAFSDASDWTTPAPQSVTVSDSQTVMAAGQYQPYGTLQAQLYPGAAVNAGVQWQVDAGAWQNSGDIVSLVPGNHTVSFNSVSGWKSPASQKVNISSSANEVSGIYVSTDSTKPTMAITIPPSPSPLWNYPNLTIAGTAQDNVAVEAVMYRVNSGTWMTANGTINWAGVVTLSPGTNMVSVYAIDNSGNTSATNSFPAVYLSNVPLRLAILGSGSVSPNYNGSLLHVGQNYSVTATAAAGFTFANWSISTNWTGNLTTNKATLTFRMQTNLTLQASFVDTQKPTLGFTLPASGQRVSNAVFTVRGTAADNLRVASLSYQINSGGWTTATGTTNWSAMVNLSPGTNILRAYAVDTTGNISTTNMVSFDLVVTNQLGVQFAGLGTLSPNYTNAWLELGRNYSLTATPATGFVFTNWTVATNWLGGTLTNKPTVQFMMASNLTLTATFKDVSRPVIAITNLTAGLRVGNPAFTVKGTASDNWRVAGVTYQINGGGWTSATGTTNWSAVVYLSPGTNVFKAYAVDISGNISLTNGMSFDCVVTNQLGVQVVGLGVLSPNYTNASLELGRNYSLTATPATGFIFTNWTVATNWLGGTLTNKPTVQFMMSSNLTLTATFKDISKPLLAITNLTPGMRVSNPAFTVKGTASDNWRVTSVTYQINGGGWTNASGTTNWSAAVNLPPGTNVLKAYAMDISGNISLTNSVSFDCVVTNRLGVQIVGLGTLSPNYTNAWLEVGRNYSLTATPAAGFVFTNWTVATNWLGGTVTNKPTAQFMMSSNLTLTATFKDISRPVVTITNLTAGLRTGNAIISVRGTSSDNWQVVYVWCQINSNNWQLASTTNNFKNWFATNLSLNGGTNLIRVYATDLGANYSITNSVSVVLTNAPSAKNSAVRLEPGSVRPAVLMTDVRMTSDGLTFNLQLSGAETGIIQISTNLVNWTTVTNFAGTNTAITFCDPASTNANYRFYRAVSQ